jgi:hypothetical protein
MASQLDGPPHALPSLDPGILQAVRSSAMQLSRLEGVFVRQLHADITVLMPDMAANGPAFAERMVRSLLWVALTDEPPNVVADTLYWVGAQNWVEGFHEAHYVNVAHAVVRTVRDISGSDQFASIGSAWVAYFLWAQPYMIAGARQVAAQHAAAEQAAAEEAAARRETAWREADRAQALALYPHDRHGEAAGDVNLEAVSDLLDDEDDEDDEDVGYGQIMVSMTRNRRRGIADGR